MKNTVVNPSYIRKNLDRLGRGRVFYLDGESEEAEIYSGSNTSVIFIISSLPSTLEQVHIIPLSGVKKISLFE